MLDTMHVKNTMHMKCTMLIICKNHLAVRTQKAERLVKTTKELNRGGMHNTHKHTLLITNKLFHFGERRRHGLK